MLQRTSYSYISAVASYFVNSCLRINDYLEDLPAGPGYEAAHGTKRNVPPLFRRCSVPFHVLVTTQQNNTQKKTVQVQ